jgi:hypothetical protein
MIGVIGNAGSDFELLSLSLFHDAHRDRSFMVMTGYFDEAGTHGGSPITVVGGFVATVAQWATYERELLELNDQFGVSVFHAKDLRNRKGDFKGWLTAKKSEYNYRFLRLADDCLSGGFAAIVRKIDYEQVYRALQFPLRVRPDTAYGLCVRICLAKALLFMKDRKSDWPLSIVMEGGNPNLGDAARVFSEVKDGLRPMFQDLLGYISFGTKRGCPPLAAADALSYAVFRMMAGHSRHPTNPNAAVVGPSNPPYFVSKIPMSRVLIDENSLALMRDEISAVGSRVAFPGLL